MQMLAFAYIILAQCRSTQNNTSVCCFHVLSFVYVFSFLNLCMWLVNYLTFMGLFIQLGSCLQLWVLGGRLDNIKTQLTDVCVFCVFFHKKNGSSYKLLNLLKENQLHIKNFIGSGWTLEQGLCLPLLPSIATYVPASLGHNKIFTLIFHMFTP